MQIWLCSDTRVLLFISIYSPYETWGVEVIIFKHDTLFAVETYCFGGYVNGLYQQSVINKNLYKVIESIRRFLIVNAHDKI